MAIGDEPSGGDPPCWSHLFAESEDAAAASSGGGAADLAAVARAATGRGPAWTLRSDDLDVNLLVFGAGEGVVEHRNAETDVLVVGVEGEGVVTVDGRPYPVGPGRAVLVRKGARRGTRASGGRFAYLTCHRRRPGLWPASGDPTVA